MAISNYSELVTAVGTWVIQGNLTAQIPDFIRLYEADANRRIRIRQNMTTVSLDLAQSTSAVYLPADFLEDIELNYNDTPEGLQRAPFDAIDRYQTADSQEDRPSMYAITRDQIVFETEADATYALNLRYYKKWDIEADTTNWLLTNAPDCYLFGSVAEAALYARDNQLLQIAMQRRDSATEWVLKADSRTKSAVLTVDPALRSIGRFDIVRGY